MRFWDASAVVSLLVEEPTHPDTRPLLESDPAMAVWWGTPVECTSALARREREGSISRQDLRLADARLKALAAEWHEVTPTNAIRNLAYRALRVHALRAADSLQLAAALVVAEHDPATLEFVSLDSALTSAAAREGFIIDTGPF
jgi:predicted nucleic acid-binding protein